MAQSERIPDAVLAECGGIGVATLYEANEEQGALDNGIAPLYLGMTLVGRAHTVMLAPNDNRSIHDAVRTAQPGDVIVCDHRSIQSGPWGEVLTQAAVEAGCAGLVIDGCVRDSTAIAKIGFPVFCRGRSIRGTAKSTPGSVGDPVIVGGVRVLPGDLIVGDDDGVCAVSASRVEAVIRAAGARLAQESQFIDLIRAGRTTWDLLRLDESPAQAD